ncbi:MAG: ABC transporter substrate-binding protein, partial [Clostridia bacterium]|nr:ABC transporter substrate-binding protein [Clostridia bacterium]
VVEAGAGLNVEQIISLSPQLVVMGDMGQTEEQVQALEMAGVKVLVSDAHNIAGTYETIEMLGKATGKNAEASALVMEMKNAFEAIRAKSKNSGKTVYFEVSPLEYGLWSAGKNTFMDEIAAMLGLTNTFADLTDWGEVSEEQVIGRNPDYIVTVTMYFGEGPTPEEEILSRKGWESIGAVKNKQVFRVDSDSISRPGPRLTEAAEALYAYVYGDATNENS